MSAGQSPPPTLVSLFAGAGGLDIGLEQAGFGTVAATDFDRDCVATLHTSKDAGLLISGTNRRYLEHAKIIHAPIEELSGADLRPAGVRSDWRPDLITGGPPCQPFSSSGKQLALGDHRGRLFEHFVRVAAELSPRLILFENVRGLVTARGPSGEPGEALAMVKQAFETIGYATRFGLLNAADFAAPQRRVRLIMVASRDAPLPLLPEPTHGDPHRGDLLGAAWVTLGEALGRLPEPDEVDVVRPTAELNRALSSISPGKGLRSPGSRESTRPGGHWGYKQGTFVADPRLPARTVTAASTQDWVRAADGSLRRLTWREAAALQGFPDGWQFVGGRASRFRQIGNAVPVALSGAVGLCLAEAHTSRQEGVRVLSAPLPRAFDAAVTYTRRDDYRNGASRQRAKAVLLAGGVPVSAVKGLGRIALGEAREA